jgi:hypothetical protein
MDKQELLQKLKELFPEFDRFGLEVDVDFDKEQNAWMAKIRKGSHELSTHLEEQDVEECVLGKKCYKFGIQLGQFIRNYCEDGEECEL